MPAANLFSVSRLPSTIPSGHGSIGVFATEMPDVRGRLPTLRALCSSDKISVQVLFCHQQDSGVRHISADRGLAEIIGKDWNSSKVELKLNDVASIPEFHQSFLANASWRQ